MHVIHNVQVNDLDAVKDDTIKDITKRKFDMIEHLL
jgi:hypothetical protein